MQRRIDLRHVKEKREFKQSVRVRLIDQIKIGPERIRMYNLSAGEGAKFAAFANEFVSKVEELGPSPINVRRSQETPTASQEETT